MYPIETLLGVGIWRCVTRFTSYIMSSGAQLANLSPADWAKLEAQYWHLMFALVIIQFPALCGTRQ